MMKETGLSFLSLGNQREDGFQLFLYSIFLIRFFRFRVRHEMKQEMKRVWDNIMLCNNEKIYYKEMKESF